ncbi:MAG: transposase, partial [Okeania sp. SIO3B5]|uniref:zinc ribbon domain-containing protein n=1 Tax=Okeania sp. SIO3B5 TaxID=2607811 RepID=UPI0013FF4435
EVSLVIRSLWELETLKSGFETEVRDSDIPIDCNYPSSQICSNCGHQQKMPLSMRTYECGHCGFTTDRDFNAAVNLENYAR